MTISVTITEGKSFHLDNFLSKLKNGDYLITVESLSNLKSEEDYRKVYFRFRDIVWETDNRGYTKNELHTIIKKSCLSKLLENSENFKNPPDSLSTKFLNELGWKNFLIEVKEFIKDEFSIFI